MDLTLSLSKFPSTANNGHHVDTVTDSLFDPPVPSTPMLEQPQVSSRLPPRMTQFHIG